MASPGMNIDFMTFVDKAAHCWDIGASFLIYDRQLSANCACFSITLNGIEHGVCTIHPERVAEY